MPTSHHHSCWGVVKHSFIHSFIHSHHQCMPSGRLGGISGSTWWSDPVLLCSWPVPLCSPDACPPCPNEPVWKWWHDNMEGIKGDTASLHCLHIKLLSRRPRSWKGLVILWTLHKVRCHVIVLSSHCYTSPLLAMFGCVDSPASRLFPTLQVRIISCLATSPYPQRGMHWSSISIANVGYTFEEHRVISTVTGSCERG